MKKKITLFCAAVLVFSLSGIAVAQERVLNFVSYMQVQEDGSAIVEETIVVNAEHIKIRRGLIRDIPNRSFEPVKFISLLKDDIPHPSFTEYSRGYININFGDDNYISRGRHTYKLTYSIANVVKDFKDYDEVYWNVTGNDWDFVIERASFIIHLPEGANIKDKLVSMYTGKKGSKASNAVRKEKNSFEITKPLLKGEGFTVAVPFEKGIVQSYKKTILQLAGEDTIILIIAFLIFAGLIAYYVFSWFDVGRDPKDVIVTEFAPPKGISPAFLRCLWVRDEDPQALATAIISLAMKGKIEITEEMVAGYKNIASLGFKIAVLKLKDRNTEGLPKEEKCIMELMFGNRKEEFKINSGNALTVSSCMSYIERRFSTDKKKYLVSNVKYITVAIIALLLYQILFIYYGAASAIEFIFINIHYSILLLGFVNIFKSKILKVIFFTGINLFYSVFFYSAAKSAGLSGAIIEGFFLLSLWAFIIYSNIIDNLTEEGRELFKHINGFHRYMTIAEERRVAESVPIDNERIFADYLPYAFAFNMENEWMKRFEKTLTRDMMEHYMKPIGGTSLITNRLLATSISVATSRSSGRSGSGSGGGGRSGGGSGGGGGRGR